MTLYYEGSDGTIIDFMSGDLSAQNPETLAENSWKYSSISGINGGRIKKFYKEAQEATLNVEVFCDNKDDFDALMYKMHKTFERDLRRMTPGKLWWNGFYKEVFAVANSYEEFEELFESVQKEITFVSIYPYWIKETKHVFFPATNEEDHTGFDYPHDYLFDYGVSDHTKAIVNDCIEAANFQIAFYGPFTNPHVIVGGNIYRINTTLGIGERAVVDSRTKKITQISPIGEATNIFHLRDRNNYIFTKIPEGTLPVAKPKELAVEVMIYDERGEPDWI